MRRSRSIVALAAAAGMVALAPGGSAAPPPRCHPGGADRLRPRRQRLDRAPHGGRPGADHLGPVERYRSCLGTGHRAPRFHSEDVDRSPGLDRRHDRRLAPAPAEPGFGPDLVARRVLDRLRPPSEGEHRHLDGRRRRVERSSTHELPSRRPRARVGPSKIAFMSSRGGRLSIWVMAPGGRGERRLTEGKGRTARRPGSISRDRPP